MTLQTNSAIIQDEEGRRPRWLGLACATLLTGILVVGLGSWRLQEQDSVHRTESTSATVVTTSQVDQSVVREVIASRYLFLVSSEEEATLLWHLLSEGIAHRYQLGDRSQTISVLVAKGLDSDAINFLTILQPVQELVDLRVK